VGGRNLVEYSVMCLTLDPALFGIEGQVKVWDPRQQGSPVVSFGPSGGETARDTWTVAFGSCCLSLPRLLFMELDRPLSITGNAFTDVDRMVCAGYDNGDLKMFDLRNMDTLWTTNLGHGVSLTAIGALSAFPAPVSDIVLHFGSLEQVCSSEFDRKDVKMNKLVATTTNSTYYTFDLRTFNPDSGFASLRHNVGRQSR